MIEDSTRSMVPFFRKLNEMNGPVRVVHIGDSHVRGHVYPLVDVYKRQLVMVALLVMVRRYRDVVSSKIMLF